MRSSVKQISTMWRTRAYHARHDTVVMVSTNMSVSLLNTARTHNALIAGVPKMAFTSISMGTIA